MKIQDIKFRKDSTILLPDGSGTIKVNTSDIFKAAFDIRTAKYSVEILIKNVPVYLDVDISDLVIL